MAYKRHSGYRSVVNKIFYTKKGSVAATTIAVVIFGWLGIESAFLSGEALLNVSQHTLEVPIKFAVKTPGVPHGLTVDRAHRRRGKKRLAWTITQPDGTLLVEDHDIIARSTRKTKFIPEMAGNHTLLVRRHPADGVAGSVTLIITQGDRTILLPVLDFLW